MLPRMSRIRLNPGTDESRHRLRVSLPNRQLFLPRPPKKANRAPVGECQFLRILCGFLVVTHRHPAKLAVYSGDSPTRHAFVWSRFAIQQANDSRSSRGEPWICEQRFRPAPRTQQPLRGLLSAPSGVEWVRVCCRTTGSPESWPKTHGCWGIAGGF